MRADLARPLRSIREHVMLVVVCVVVAVAFGNLMWASRSLAYRLQDHIVYGEHAMEKELDRLRNELEEERSERRVLELKLEDLEKRFLRSECIGENNDRSR